MSIAFEVSYNTPDALAICFQPDDGSQYQLHLMKDAYGGVLIASTFASKGLYRWFPQKSEIKAISHIIDQFGNTGCVYFMKHLDGWMNMFKIGGFSISDIAKERWC